jgi:hypothetical protein
LDRLEAQQAISDLKAEVIALRQRYGHTADLGQMFNAYKQKAARVFTEMDSDADGCVSYSEYLDFLHQPEPGAEVMAVISLLTGQGSARDTFSAMDYDQDGKVCWEEFLAWIYSSSQPPVWDQSEARRQVDVLQQQCGAHLCALESLGNELATKAQAAQELEEALEQARKELGRSQAQSKKAARENDALKKQVLDCESGREQLADQLAKANERVRSAHKQTDTRSRAHADSHAQTPVSLQLFRTQSRAHPCIVPPYCVHRCGSCGSMRTSTRPTCGTCKTTGRRARRCRCSKWTIRSCSTRGTASRPSLPSSRRRGRCALRWTRSFE